MTRQYRSKIAGAIHETIEDFYSGGLIDKQTMRKFDALCLTPIRKLTAGEIKALREREQVSQSVFANYLNVSKSVISQWECGQKRPAGTSLKLLALVEKNGLSAIL